jgi:hypothetical protein
VNLNLRHRMAKGRLAGFRPAEQPLRTAVDGERISQYPLDDVDIGAPAIQRTLNIAFSPVEEGHGQGGCTGRAHHPSGCAHAAVRRFAVRDRSN